MLNYPKYKEFIVKHEYVNIDELLMDQGILPSSHFRKCAARQLKKDGFVEHGSKTIEGKKRRVWRRGHKKDDLDLEVRRLELLSKRQDQDVRTIESLLEKGFSRPQCLEYLRMLYNCETELLDRYQEEEKEAQEFADRISSQVNTKYAATRLITCTAYMFYVEKYFPELTSEDKYEYYGRKVRASLVCKKEDSGKKYEWAALSFHPHFLDLTTKIGNEGDDKEYKEWLVKRYLTPETLDKFFSDEINYKHLAAMSIVSRRVAAGDPYRDPYGVGPTLAKKIKRHVEGLKIEDE